MRTAPTRGTRRSRWLNNSRVMASSTSRNRCRQMISRACAASAIANPRAWRSRPATTAKTAGTSGGCSRPERSTSSRPMRRERSASPGFSRRMRCAAPARCRCRRIAPPLCTRMPARPRASSSTTSTSATTGAWNSCCSTARSLQRRVSSLMTPRARGAASACARKAPTAMPDALVPLRHDRGDHHDSPLARALRREVDGEVRFDRGTRALYATDSSNYRQVPIGAVVPRTIEALIATVALCREHEVPIFARGGGTSLAGQTCNEAVVIDCSRNLTMVTVDREARLAHVQPGTIMKSLRDAANKVGLDFGPDPSTHDRCTLGGMLGNNSCGVLSVFSEFYGPGPRTSDHVEELEVLTYRGTQLRAAATNDIELSRIIAAGGEPARIYEALRELRDRYEPQIRTTGPDMPRRGSGYNLPDLLPEARFQVGRALVASESTCVMILGAALKLMPAKPCRALAVLGYPDIFQVAAAANAARDDKPVGCEAMDDVLIRRIKSQHRDHDHAISLLGKGKAWLMVEFGADTIDEARDAAQRCAKRLAPLGTNILVDPELRQKLADMRAQALGVDAFAPGKPDNYEGWEDSAVPPERLEHYLREFHALLGEYKLEGSLYGHFGQGCVHTRIDFGLDHVAGARNYHAFTAAAAKLVVAHGGSLSGEHGDGQSRAELHEVMFGREIVQAFDEFKAIWDPDWKMNPGKMTRANPRTSHLRLIDSRPHPGPIEMVHGDDHKDFGHAAVRCVGVGKCRTRDAGAMCPSYMATLD